MLNILKTTTLVLFVFFLLGFVLPALISAKSTELVLFGIFVLAFFINFIIYKSISTIKGDK